MGHTALRVERADRLGAVTLSREAETSMMLRPERTDRMVCATIAPPLFLSTTMASAL
jgi:hypothetical protein